MMEVLAPSETLWKLQNEFAQKILKINNYVTDYATKIRPLDHEDWLKLLKLELEILPFFKADLLAIKETSEIVKALEIYSVNKEKYIKEYPYEILATFTNPRIGEMYKREFSSWGAFQKNKETFKKKEFDVIEWKIIPPREWIIYFAKALLDAGAKMEILKPKKQIKPIVKFGDVYARRAACDESIRKILDE